MVFLIGRWWKKEKSGAAELSFNLWWDQQTADLLKMYHIKKIQIISNFFLKQWRRFAQSSNAAPPGEKIQKKGETAEIKSLSYSAWIIITEDQNNDAYQQTVQRFFPLWQEDEAWRWHDGIKAENRTWLLPAVTMEIWGKRTYELLMSVRGRVRVSVFLVLV